MEPVRPTPEPNPQGPAAERRTAPRLTSSLKITCYPVGASLLERRQGRMRNVSRTGIGVLVDRAWQSGTNVMLELPIGEEESIKSVRARVIHATAQLGGTFLVGCSFEVALSDAEVQILAR